MFKIFVPITKSSKTLDNLMLVEGIASSPSIDVHIEKFSDEALKKMENSVNKGNLPIKVEHEYKFYSDIGVWKEAKLLEDGRLYVKGEIDLNLSLGRDLEVLLSKGMDIALSVGGKVYSSKLEYDKTLDKTVKIYTDVSLDEISVVKSPANKDTELSIAKSFDFEKQEETEFAKSITEDSEKYQLATSEYRTILDGIEKEIEKKFEFTSESDFIKSDYDEDEGCMVASCTSFTSEQLAYLSIMMRIMSSINVNEYSIGLGASPSNGILPNWEVREKMPLYCFVPMPNDLTSKSFPYRNEDFSVNKAWVEYLLVNIACGEYSWYSQKERTYLMNFLYAAYLQVIANKKKSAEGLDVNNIEKSKFEVPRLITQTEFDLMKSCIDFKNQIQKNRPQVSGNDLSDTEINKLAKAYEVLTKRNSTLLSNTTFMLKEELKKQEEVISQETVTENAEVTETKADEVSEETEVTTQEVAEESTVAKTEGEEANTDTSENNTGIVEETKTEDTSTDVLPEETTEKSLTLEDVQKLIDSSIEKSTSSLIEKLDSIQKALDSNAEMVSKSEKASSDFAKSISEGLEEQKTNVNEIVKTVSLLGEQVSMIGKNSAGRKGVAVFQPIEKSGTSTGSESLEDLVQKYMDEDKLEWKVAYAKAKTTIASR